MLDIIDGIINYVPLKSVKEMLNAKVYSLVHSEEHASIEEGGVPHFNINTKEFSTKYSKLEKSKDLDGILRNILNTFETNYKIGDCYNDEFQIKKSDIYHDNTIRLIEEANRIIAMKSRFGLATTLLVPEQYYDFFDNNSFLECLPNPLEEYKDKIFVLRSEVDSTTTKYHLLTDRDIENDRALKINKIIKGDPIDINYIILPVDGHQNTVVVINIV